MKIDNRIKVVLKTLKLSNEEAKKINREINKLYKKREWRAKKEGYINKICEITGDDRQTVVSKMEMAKSMGMPYYRYFNNKCWDMSENEINSLIEKKDTLRVSKMKNFNVEKYEYKAPSYEIKERKKNIITDKNSMRYKQHDDIWKSEKENKNEISILIVGDLLCQEGLINNYKTGDSTFDFTLCFDYIRALFQSADFVVGNLETPISETAPYRGEIISHEGPFYCNAPIEYLCALQYANIDMLTTANNHTLDAGALGIYETIENIKKLGFIQTGTSEENGEKYVIVDICGFKVGITAFSTTYNTMETNLNDYGRKTLLNTYTKDSAKKIYNLMKKKGAEFTLCFPHWGKEFSYDISERQKKMAKELSIIGFDFIAGSHSHLVQKFGYVNQTPVLFSLGNILTHMNHAKKLMDTQYPIICNVKLKRENKKVISNIKFIPCRILKNVNQIPFLIVPYEKNIDYSEEILKKIEIVPSKIQKLLDVGDELLELEYPLNAESLEALDSALKNVGQRLKNIEKLEDGSDETIAPVVEKLNFDEDDLIYNDIGIYKKYSDHAELISITSNARVIRLDKNIAGLPVTKISIDKNNIEKNIRLIYLSSVTEIIGANSFSDHISLESVRLFNNLESIGDNAFTGCIKMTGIVIPNSLKRIGKKAFQNCKSLLSIKIPSNVEYIGEDAFEGCPKLTIYCEENSYAYRYAQKHGIKFKFMPLKSSKNIAMNGNKQSLLGPMNDPEDKYPEPIIEVCNILGHPLPSDAICKYPPSKYIGKDINMNSLVNLKSVLGERFPKIKEETLKKNYISFKRKFKSQKNMEYTNTDLSVFFSDWLIFAREKGCTHNCYFDYEFYNKEENIRDTFLNEKDRTYVNKLCGTDGYRKILFNKGLFNKKFAKFVKRKWLDVSNCSYEEFEHFLKEEKVLFGKPIKGTGGAGVRIIEYNEKIDLEKIYSDSRKEELILEEIIRQHPDLAEFNKSTLNTVRVVTLLCADGTPKIIAASARFGRKGSVVDNFHGGGVSAVVNIDNGRIVSQAINRGHQKSSFHPDSGKKILGFQYPEWDKVKSAVCEAAVMLPEMRSVGWDVAVTESGEIEFVEGNGKPNWDILQSPDQIGKRFMYGNLLGEIEKLKKGKKQNYNFEFKIDYGNYNNDFFEKVDLIENIRELEEIENLLTDKNIMKFFWEEYNSALYDESEVVRKKAKIKCRYIAFQYGAIMPFSKNINRFKTPHGLRGIGFSQYVKIGKNCTIYQHAMIGAVLLPGSKNGGFPEVGNNVSIGMGAKIIGNVKIGDNARIGPNCVVTDDIPANSIVVLPKPVVIERKTPLDNKFIPAKKYKEEFLNIKNKG